jgi:predicted unusual protein kinase regulating ubiquinone biosynthesis (AarF/ABC1/UbiB family)
MFIIHIFLAFVRYMIGLSNYETFITQMFARIVEHNILFVKIFQALSANKHVSDEALQLFRKYTNKSDFYERDIDYEMLTEACDKYNIVLESKEPINSGMIALVFKGVLDGGQVVAIKTHRKNVASRLKKGHKEFVFFYHLLKFVFSPFGYGEVFESISSFVDTQDYIMTQCHFKDEIYAMTEFKKELQDFVDLGTITHFDKITVPLVYNKPDDDKYMIMEFVTGKSIFDINVDEKQIVAEIILTIGISQLPLFNINHTDLHPGNMMFTNDGKLAIFDFGMFVKMRPIIKESFFEFMRIESTKDTNKEYINTFKLWLEPIPDLSKYTKQQIDDVNKVCEYYIGKIFSGHLDERGINEFKKKADESLPGLLTNSRLDIEIIKIILSNTMCNSTVYSLVDNAGPLQVKVKERLCKEIFS